MSSTRSPGTVSRKQHRSGLPPWSSTCTATRFPASSTPAALICASTPAGIASNTSLVPVLICSVLICSESELPIPGKRPHTPEREVRPWALLAGIVLMHPARRVEVLQGQLSLRAPPRAGTRIGHALAGDDLGGHAAAPLGAIWLVGERPADEGK